MIRQILTDTITSVFQSDTALVVDTKFRGNPKRWYCKKLTDAEFAEFRKAIIDIFCGVDWYISYPGSQSQVNEEALVIILQRIEKRMMKRKNGGN